MIHAESLITYKISTHLIIKEFIIIDRKPFR